MMQADQEVEAVVERLMRADIILTTYQVPPRWHGPPPGGFPCLCDCLVSAVDVPARITACV